MSLNTSNPRIKLPHSVIVKAPGLLPMLYTVHEMAEELSLPERTLRDWLAGGAPHTRDRLNHIWINGQVFAEWIASLRKKPPDSRLKPGEGFCLTCKQAVKMVQPVQRPSANGRLVYITGSCPNCKGKVTRGARRDPAQ